MSFQVPSLLSWFWYGILISPYSFNQNGNSHGSNEPSPPLQRFPVHLVLIIPSSAFYIRFFCNIIINLILTYFFHLWASLLAQTVKKLPAMQETRVRSLVQEDPLEKEMATHSSTLAWETLWTEEPGGLQSIRLQQLGHDGSTNTTLFQLILLHLALYLVCPSSPTTLCTLWRQRLFFIYSFILSSTLNIKNVCWVKSCQF